MILISDIEKMYMLINIDRQIRKDAESNCLALKDIDCTKLDNFDD